MSSTTLAEDFAKLREEWQNIDPVVRMLDILIIANLALFILGYLVRSLANIALTATNAGFLVFPLIVAGFLYVYRDKVSNPEEDDYKARLQFRNQILLTLGLLVIGVIFAIIMIFVIAS